MEKEIKEELFFFKSLIRTLTADNRGIGDKLEESLKLLLEKVRGAHGSIMLVSNHEFQIVASTNKSILHKRIPIDPKTISGHVYVTGKPLYFKDVTKSRRFKNKIHKSNYSTPSLMCIPLKGQHKIIGVVTVSDHLENRFFSREDFLLMKDYTLILSPLLENSCLFHRLKKEKEKYERLAQELKVSKEELQMTYQERSELVEMVVHDFKSPLSAVISNLELLKYVGVEEKLKPIIETALNGAKKLLDMINEFLQLAKLDEVHRQKESFGPVSLVSVLRKVLDEVEPVADAKSIEIEFDSQEDVLLWGSKSLFFHLFQNLLSNAIKYTPEQGKVKVFWKVNKAKRKEDRFGYFCKICVEDTGPGIPDDQKKFIFDRFERLKRDKNVQGTGIGLFICKRIVNLLEGKVWVEDAVPSGSRFCVTCYVWEGKNA